MPEEKISSLLLLLFLLTTTAAGQNFSATTTVLETPLAQITNFSVTTGAVVNFFFIVSNAGNTNISVFPEISVYDSNNNMAVQLIYDNQIDISTGSQRDMQLSWNTQSTGTFTARLVVFYDNNTRYANATLIFVLSPPSSDERSGGAGSSGGGGAGVVSKEPPSNIIHWEIRENYLYKDVPSSYVFMTPELPVFEVLITPTKNLGTRSVKVELLKGLQIINRVVSAPYDAYRYLNIWFGEEESRKQDSDAIVKFKVDINWFTVNTFDGSKIRLMRWDENKWTALDTELKSSDEKFAYYEAKTDAFGNFAISTVPFYSENILSFQKPENTSTFEKTHINESAAQPILPPIPPVYAITAVILIGIILYLLKLSSSKNYPQVSSVKR